MLWLQPQLVTITIGSTAHQLDHVDAIALSSASSRLIVEQTDIGPYPSFVDSPEVRITLTLKRALTQSNAAQSAALTPGAQGVLSFHKAPNASDTGGAVVTAAVVISAVEHDLSAVKGASQTIRCIAISSDGSTYPVAEQEDAP